ncbi:MAG TPA: Xaa-Pro peptidase family protein [Sphingomicrobium sp.]|nr:Xaa-Pro peptidase family protein [Sphingomicrobium sp.]
MRSFSVGRRGFIGLGGATAAAVLPPSRAAAAATTQLVPVKLPPPITTAERLARIARARALMRQNGIGAIIVEPGASLDYFTGVQWWRSERLTAAVIPVEGDPIIVTPFFERPSVEESLAIPAEFRTWNEDEDPLRFVADFLKERGVAAQPIGFEESDRYFIFDHLSKQLPSLKAVSANPVVRGCRMIKSPAEIALMQAATEITVRAMRHAGERAALGMIPRDFSKAIDSATIAMGGSPEFSLVLIGEGSAYPHGTRQPQKVQRGSVVLFDCGCTVHGYQSDVSRTFVFGADPTAEQRKVWDQVHRGQEIAFAAAKIGVPAGSVDDAVRRAYESWGYGPGYKLPGLSHRTGHGIGMEGHEPVNLVHGETTLLAHGMCFSDEPGIYLPGKFGVRLEDCFHMTEAGPKFFSNPPPSIDRPFG